MVQFNGGWNVAEIFCAPPDNNIEDFNRNNSTRFRDITDGTSNTFCAGERRHEQYFKAGLPGVASNSTWYAAIPGFSRPGEMSGMMSSATEGPGIHNFGLGCLNGGS